MAWILLIVSGLFEAVWATALSRSEGLSRLIPSLVFVSGLIVSMGGLAQTLRSVPVGAGYAVWVGTGAAATAAWAMITGAEPVCLPRVLLLTGIVACVVGLRLTGS